MIEALMAGGSGGGYYPNSGPGPKKLLVGDEQLGYFGTVSEDLLNNPADIIVEALARSSSKTTYTGFNNTLWNKFFFQGKVVYLPIKPIAYGFSYHDIAKAGMLLGTDMNAVWSAYASYPSYSVKQNFRIIANDNGAPRSLKVRAIQNTPWGSVSVNATSEAFLLLNTHYGTALNEVSKFGSFQKAIVPPSEPLLQICAVVDANGGHLNGSSWTYILRSTPTGLVTYINATVESITNYFRPVLELETDLDVTFKYVYAVTDLVGNSSTNMVYQPAAVEPDIDLKQIAFESISATGLASQGIALEGSSPDTAVVRFKKITAQIATSTGISEALAADVKKMSESVMLLAQATGSESFPDPHILAPLPLATPVTAVESAPYLFDPYFKSSVTDYPIVTALFQKV